MTATCRRVEGLVGDVYNPRTRHRAHKRAHTHTGDAAGGGGELSEGGVCVWCLEGGPAAGQTR